MSDLAQLYRSRVSKTLTLTVALMVLLGVLVLAAGLWSIWYGRPAFASSTELAQQGDFIGGHLAAVAGFLTLAIVIYTSFTQSQQQQRFFMRGYFVHGVELVGEAMQRGDQLHAYRLIDYFSRLAKSERDDELFLILNTILSGTLRSVFEKPDQDTLGNYPFAATIMADIARIQERKALQRKGLTKRWS